MSILSLAGIKYIKKGAEPEVESERLLEDLYMKNTEH